MQNNVLTSFIVEAYRTEVLNKVGRKETNNIINKVTMELWSGQDANMSSRQRQMFAELIIYI